MNDDIETGTGTDGRDEAREDLREDVVHGLLAALADRERAAAGSTAAIDDEEDDRADRPRSVIARIPFLTRALAAVAMIALATLVALPFVGSNAARAADVVRDAQRHFLSAARVYEIRVTRWAGPVSRRLMTGEVSFHPGPPPVSEGFLVGGNAEGEKGAWRVTLGRDANGPWVAGKDGVHRARLIVRQIVGEDDDGLHDQDVEAMTLEAVLARLDHGYDLEMFGTPTMRTVVAKRRDGVRGPTRVELELARDGRTVERAKVEIARPTPFGGAAQQPATPSGWTPGPAVIELRLREGGQGTGPRTQR